MKIGRWDRNKFYDEAWPDEFHEFWKIDNDPISVSWNKDYVNNYLKLADEYYQAACSIANEILQSEHSNEKNDRWFLSDIFMFRQSVELILKAKVYMYYSKKQEVQKIFHDLKHNVSGLFKLVKNFENDNLTNYELIWIEDYLNDMEQWDRNSSVFRYPFSPKFMEKNPPKFVDIYRTTVKMDITYSLIRSTFKESGQFKGGIPNELPHPEFFTEANDGMENCYLGGMVYSDSFFSDSSKYYTVVNGYLAVSEFLLTNDHKYVYPALFSLRHLIELELKQLSSSDYSEIKSLNFRMGSHKIYSDFWKKLRPIIEKTNQTGESTVILDDIGSFIEQLQLIDKEGSFFRYPAEYNHQVHYISKKIDSIHILTCVRAISNLLSGCSSMFDCYSEYESEMYL